MQESNSEETQTNLSFMDNNELFIYGTREKHNCENRLFASLCKFVTSIILVVMLQEYKIPLMEFPQSLLSPYMLWQAIMSAFWAILIVSWQYFEIRLLKIGTVYVKGETE